MLGWVRSLFSKVAPSFEEGGKLHKFYPVFESIDSFLFEVSHRTRGSLHIRDGIDLKRVMIEVYIAVIPVVIAGCYFTGYYALSLVSEGKASLPTDYHGLIAHALIGNKPIAEPSFLMSFLYGLSFFLPLYFLVFVVGTIWELIFAVVRNHEVNEGFFITTILFTLSLPPTISLWQAALGISFGLVVGKEIFGGGGMNFLNPALVGRMFLYFAYPSGISGDKVWVPVGSGGDVQSGATWLSRMKEGHTDVFDFSHALVGNMPGSMGETSAIVIALAGAYLMIRRIASWRTILGGILGVMVMGGIFKIFGSQEYPLANIPPYQHLVLGGFAFGIVFMATDPVSSPMTETARLYYGFLIGVLTVLIRVVNPGYPEGVMLAILFANLTAPILDRIFMAIANRKRLKRYARRLSEARRMASKES